MNDSTPDEMYAMRRTQDKASEGNMSESRTEEKLREVWGHCGDCGGTDFQVIERCSTCGCAEILEHLKGSGSASPKGEPSAPLASPREGNHHGPFCASNCECGAGNGPAVPREGQIEQIVSSLRALKHSMWYGNWRKQVALFEEAAQSLEVATLRERQLRELVEKWRKEADESHPMVSISHPLSLREHASELEALIGERETTQK